jgi:hypothetical protein
MWINFSVATAPDYIRAILSAIDSGRTMALHLRRSIDAPMFESGSEVFSPVVKLVDKGHDSFQSGDKLSESDASQNAVPGYAI